MLTHYVSGVGGFFCVCDTAFSAVERVGQRNGLEGECNETT